MDSELEPAVFCVKIYVLGDCEVRSCALKIERVGWI